MQRAFDAVVRYICFDFAPRVINLLVFVSVEVNFIVYSMLYLLTGVFVTYHPSFTLFSILF